ncbi:MAG: type VI secretion system baseplate subunit TssG [Planctomycetaceae bacterium]|nr:type VI secretion system baseplate subunit TssG [Planctomycetaceae bacterium]
MATSGGESNADLIQELLKSPQDFEFFQAVRIIERMVVETSRGQRTPVGGEGDAAKECLRFRALASLCFPSGQIADVKVQHHTDRISQAAAESRAAGSSAPEIPRYDMTVPFMGLTGPEGALPQHYTSAVIERSHLRNKDYAVQEFFDLFNHRAISFFYRAWEKYRFPFAFERRLRDGIRQDDLFTCSLMSLVGLGAEHQRERFPFEDQTIVAYGGLFAAATRTAVGLEQIIGDCFRLRTAVEQFVGQWLQLAPEDQSCLPSNRSVFGQNLQLSEDTIVGSCVWDVQSRFRVVLGPLTHTQFLKLLPGGPQLQAIIDLIRFYAGINRDFDIQLILKKEDVPVCCLTDDISNEPRLGWTTWLPGVEQREVDSRDVSFRF